jgi:hypothetical protein
MLSLAIPSRSSSIPFSFRKSNSNSNSCSIPTSEPFQAKPSLHLAAVFLWAHAFSRVAREAPVRTEPLPYEFASFV